MTVKAILVWSALLTVLATVAPVAAENAELRPWNDYRVIMWVGDSAAKQPQKLPLFFARLREMGVDTAMVYGAGGNPEPLLTNHFPYYVENIVNRGLCLKWNSRVTDWDKVVTDWARNGRPESALVREYCFDDPAWLESARQEMRAAARTHGPRQPLAYNIRDELSVTISANPFDYDFSPAALAAFRAWLQTQYADLAALNAEWETQFATWDGVRPFTTDQIKNRMASGEALPRGKPDWQAVQQLKFDPVMARQSLTRWNLAPWCDFRSYMDLSLARTLDDLRHTARAVDPATPVGIEGTQMPSAWGGYDLWRLAQALDWVEPYDIGNAREILGSFMPGKPILTTVFEDATNAARRRLWHLLLEGDRGCLIWWSEDCLDWKSSDLALTPKAKALAPVLKELRSPLARLLLGAQPEGDPIAIAYSQPSIQVDWLLESTVDGSTWLRRFSSFEADHNRLAAVRDGWVRLFQDLGYRPRFVSTQQILDGDLRRGDLRVLVLPQALAMSAKEAEEIRAFIATAPAGARRAVFADGSPADFDEHGRLRAQSPLADLFPPATSAGRSQALVSGAKAVAHDGDIAVYPKARLAAEPDLAWARWAAGQMADLHPAVTVPGVARVRVHRFTAGGARLLAFERGVDYHMSEGLKQAGGNQALEKPIEVEATLAVPAEVYELGTETYVGRVARLRFTLDPWRPSLFALVAEKLPAGKVIAQLLATGSSR
jgi:hypothetical protein